MSIEMFEVEVGSMIEYWKLLEEADKYKAIVQGVVCSIEGDTLEVLRNEGIVDKIYQEEITMNMKWATPSIG